MIKLILHSQVSIVLLNPDQARFFCIWEFFSDLGSGVGWTKKSENDQVTGHFQSFFFNISRKPPSKIGKVNINLKMFRYFPKNLDRTITYQCHSQKYTDRTSKKYIFF